MSNKTKKLGVSALGIVDNMVFSRTDCMAYYKVTNEVFDFLSQGQKVALAHRLNNAFANIMSDKTEALDCHIIVTSMPIDIDGWEEEIRRIANDTTTPAPGFNQFVNEQVNHLKQQAYTQKVAYLGINLGKRNALDLSGLNVLEHGVTTAKKTLNTWLKTILQTPTEEISSKEEATFRRREEEYARILRTGNLQAEPASTEELLMFIKKQFYPAFEMAPPLITDYENRVGAGDIIQETGHVIENHYRWLKIIQMHGKDEVAGYRATMTFADFPKRSFYPISGIPFFYYPSLMGAPFTLYSRFLLTPSTNMKAEVEKKRKEQKDELENVTTGQDQYDAAMEGVPQGTAQAIRDLNEISSIVDNDKMPWVQGTYSIIIEAPAENTLREYCDQLKQAYDDIGIKLQWTAGDQKELFKECLPGDHSRSKSFKQTTNLAMLSTSGFSFSSDVGDDFMLQTRKHTKKY